ncbi:MAG: hypothetical protein U0572_12500 [Phycisphaerales bacterium]
MSTSLPVTGKVTFTISSLPRTASATKTLERLMRMNAKTQSTLSKLTKTRMTKLNERRPRAGRMWLTRVRATRLVTVEVGKTFTLTMTPQIAPDIKSVEKYLTAKR